MASPRLLAGRHSLQGAAYIVTTVTAARRPVLALRQAAKCVITELLHAERQNLAASLAWVVMPDHLHWMFVLHARSLSQLVQRVKSCSARRINALGGSAGTIWQPGFYDHHVRATEDLAAQARYILANPVRRGLAQRIGEYPHAWCRYVTSEHDF